jgi:hypothetical protein
MPTPVRRPAAFTPGERPQPCCPRCWSRPRLGDASARRRGWRVQAATVDDAPPAPDADLFTEREGLRVATSIYPCSNAACDSAIVVRSELGGGYLDADVSLHRVPAAFTRGRWDRDGVWRDAAGDPRTAPVQRDLFG